MSNFTDKSASNSEGFYVSYWIRFFFFFFLKIEATLIHHCLTLLLRIRWPLTFNLTQTLSQTAGVGAFVQNYHVPNLRADPRTSNQSPPVSSTRSSSASHIFCPEAVISNMSDAFDTQRTCFLSATGGFWNKSWQRPPQINGQGFICKGLMDC